MLYAIGIRRSRLALMKLLILFGQGCFMEANYFQVNATELAELTDTYQ